MYFLGSEIPCPQLPEGWTVVNGTAWCPAHVFEDLKKSITVTLDFSNLQQDPRTGVITFKDGA